MDGDACASGQKRAREEDGAADETMTLIRKLRGECGDGASFVRALSTISTMLSNVLEHPTEERFRTVRRQNATFHNRVGMYPSAAPLLRSLGFEDAWASDGPQDGAPTHLALVESDASVLARGLVLLEASRQAAELVDPAATGAEGAPASARPSYTVAEGKRPASAAGPRAAADARTPAAGSDSAAAGAATSRGLAADGTAVPELSDFSAEGIDKFFERLAGREGESLADLDAGSHAALVSTATEALRVSAATASAPAQRRASHWLSVLREHAALMGWDECEPATGGPAAPDEAAADDDAAAAVGEDGNFEACSHCGLGGTLICCEGCPQVYHPECLGDFAPPPDDDGDWYCPQCAKALGM